MNKQQDAAIQAFNDLADDFITREKTYRAVIDYIHYQKNGDAAKAWTVTLCRQSKILFGATYEENTYD